MLNTRKFPTLKYLRFELLLRVSPKELQILCKLGHGFDEISRVLWSLKAVHFAILYTGLN
jgi:hypothetical protein